MPDQEMGYLAPVQWREASVVNDKGRRRRVGLKPAARYGGAVPVAGFISHWPESVAFSQASKPIRAFSERAGLVARRRARAGLRPCDMARSRAMAGLTGHAETRPGGRVGICREIVVLFQIGRVAGSALVIPSLVAAGPVQQRPRLELLVRVEVEPALATLGLRSRIPGKPEHLVAAVGKSNQILLQWIDAECVCNLVVMQFSVGTVGAHHEFVADARESTHHTEILN